MFVPGEGGGAVGVSAAGSEAMQVPEYPGSGRGDRDTLGVEVCTF